MGTEPATAMDRVDRADGVDAVNFKKRTSTTAETACGGDAEGDRLDAHLRDVKRHRGCPADAKDGDGEL